jgi:hypothetical protein
MRIAPVRSVRASIAPPSRALLRAAAASFAWGEVRADEVRVLEVSVLEGRVRKVRVGEVSGRWNSGRLCGLPAKGALRVPARIPVLVLPGRLGRRGGVGVPFGARRRRARG